MTSGQIFAEDYNNQLLYVHAVKVFLMSYPEHFNANLDDNQLLFGAKVRQLMRLLDDLYQQQMSATPGPVLNFVWKQCQSLTYFLIFAVKRFIGRTLSENLSFSVTNTNTSDQIGPMALDHSCEVQSNKFLFKDYAFINMIVARRENPRLPYDQSMPRNGNRTPVPKHSSHSALASVTYIQRDINGGSTSAKGRDSSSKCRSESDR